MATLATTQNCHPKKKKKKTEKKKALHGSFFENQICINPQILNEEDEHEESKVHTRTHKNPPSLPARARAWSSAMASGATTGNLFLAKVVDRFSSTLDTHVFIHCRSHFFVSIQESQIFIQVGPEFHPKCFPQKKIPMSV
jgi:hypothetical protein